MLFKRLQGQITHFSCEFKQAYHLRKKNKLEKKMRGQVYCNEVAKEDFKSILETQKVF